MRRFAEIYVCLVVLFSYFSLDSCLYSDHVACQPSFCSCLFPDGYGIDMKSLKTADFQLNDTTNNLTYHLKFCSDVAIENSTTCASTSLYSLHTDGNVTHCQNLGSTKDLTYVWERKSDAPMLQYVTGNITSKVHLECDESSGVNLLKLLSSSKEAYEFQAVSKGVCPGYVIGPGGGGSGGGGKPSSGTSVITVIFIIILVLFLVYMVMGMLVLKFIRGAEGIEIIPNHEFWLSIPTRLKSLLLFCLAGCKDPPTYDRI